MTINRCGIKVIVAADFHKIGITDPNEIRLRILELAEVLAERDAIIKINSATMMLLKMKIFRDLARFKCRVMFDPKWVDTESTLCDYAAILASLEDAAPEFVTIMGSIEPYVLSRVQAILGEKTKICVVTVLSDETDGSSRKDHGRLLYAQLLYVAQKARSAGLDHLILPGCMVRTFSEGRYSNGMVQIATGIRPNRTTSHEHTEAVTPHEAFDAGAKYGVVGRPIITERDYHKAIQGILSENRN